MISITDCRQALPERIQRIQLEDEDKRLAVRAILEAVKAGGDVAVLDCARRFDGVEMTGAQLRVSEQEWQAGIEQVDPAVYASLEKAAANIAAFHQKQLRQTWLDVQAHTALGQLLRPLHSAGVYVPGGTAAYPSTVLMNVLPARIAGVEEIVMVTPPQREGDILPLTLAAAKLAGVTAIYRVGGAQAVAALAFGTATIPRVDKIVGPGNLYVALAKREVFGYVGIDMVAGPSEIAIVADAGARADFVAADMLSQAEHDVLACAMLITDSEALAQAVQRELACQLDKLPRADLARRSLENAGRIYLVKDIAQAMALANRIAPEHLELCVRAPFELLGSVQNAGAVFLGDYAPEPLGDYLAGPNHVLPTSGTARFFSPLGVQDFQKATSILYYDRQAMEDVWQDIDRLARTEGLMAHANAARIRFKG